LPAPREFPTTITIRDGAKLEYLPEPDIFHDVAGHVPMHTDRAFADALVRFGECAATAARRAAGVADEHERLRRLTNNIRAMARFFWFSIEFGLMRSPSGDALKAYGSGILSSYGELAHSIESPEVQREPLVIDRVVNQPFEIDHYQPLPLHRRRLRSPLRARRRARGAHRERPPRRRRGRRARRQRDGPPELPDGGVRGVDWALRCALPSSPCRCSAAACSSIDPAAKAALDQKLAQLQPSPETYPPSEIYNPMTFAVGQWTQHHVKKGKDGPELLTYKLVDKDERGFWLETLKETYSGREVAKMHVFLSAGRDPTGMEIRAIRVRKNKEPFADLDPDTARQTYQSMLDLLAVSFEGRIKDDARVPGGPLHRLLQGEDGRRVGPVATTDDDLRAPRGAALGRRARRDERRQRHGARRLRPRRRRERVLASRPRATRSSAFSFFSFLPGLLEERAVLGGAAVAEAVCAELVDEAPVVVGRLDDEDERVVPLALVRAVREQVARVRQLVGLLGDVREPLAEVLRLGRDEEPARRGERLELELVGLRPDGDDLDVDVVSATFFLTASAVTFLARSPRSVTTTSVP
jgi:hypothetical protein